MNAAAEARAGPITVYAQFNVFLALGVYFWSWGRKLTGLEQGYMLRHVCDVSLTFQRAAPYDLLYELRPKIICRGPSHEQLLRHALL